MDLDHDWCYRVVQSRDQRFDGWFVVAVRTTGIYCRPSCPARTPKAANVSFHPTAAAAQFAGYRACKRCRPDSSPGSPEWNVRSDVVARAMRLIADGVVDREGVPALARRLGYSSRHLNRLLVAELGAGALALARSQRAQNARILVETTDMPMVDVAFAAGFSSLRQFNDTVREVFDASPTELRAVRATGLRRARPGGSPSGPAGREATVTLSLRLTHRTPFAAGHMFGFLARRALERVEQGDHTVYRRTMELPHGDGAVELRPDDGFVAAVVRLVDVRDLTAAVARCRRLLDLDADPVAVDEHLGGDPLLAPLVGSRPGLRSPGAVEGFEMAVRAVVGQQVSLDGSLRAASRIVAEHGRDAGATAGGVDRIFPSPEVIASLDPGALAMPNQRARALIGVAAAVASGDLRLDPGSDRGETRARLLALPGIGPWTADYIAMRALGDPDVLAVGDLVVRRRAEALGIAANRLLDRSAPWAPWRTIAQHHLWAADDLTLLPTERMAS